MDGSVHCRHQGPALGTGDHPGNHRFVRGAQTGQPRKATASIEIRRPRGSATIGVERTGGAAGKNSAKSSFIVAFYRLPGDRYRIASSFLMKDERGPVVLGYNSYVRRKLSWSTCWDCRGDSGNVTYREDNRVVITQR